MEHEELTGYAAYDAMEGERWSHLSHMLDSPAHYRAAVERARAETDTLRVGKVLHTLCLEPQRFDTDYAVWEDRRAGNAWLAFQKANHGKTVVRPADVEVAKQAALAFRSHPEIKPLLDGLLFEVPLQWVDEATGILCKALVDGYHPQTQTHLELKSTRSTERRFFTNAAISYRYHGQLAHHGAGLVACGYPVKRTLLVGVEKVAPFDVAPFLVTPDGILRAGRAARETALRKLAECREADEWPGRMVRVDAMELPSWADPDADIDQFITGGFDDE